MYKVDIKFQYHMDVSVKSCKGCGEYLCCNRGQIANICKRLFITGQSTGRVLEFHQCHHALGGQRRQQAEQRVREMEEAAPPPSTYTTGTRSAKFRNHSGEEHVSPGLDFLGSARLVEVSVTTTLHNFCRFLSFLPLNDRHVPLPSTTADPTRSGVARIQLPSGPERHEGRS